MVGSIYLEGNGDFMQLDTEKMVMVLSVQRSDSSKNHGRRDLHCTDLINLMVDTCCHHDMPYKAYLYFWDQIHLFWFSIYENSA